MDLEKKHFSVEKQTLNRGLQTAKRVSEFSGFQETLPPQRARLHASSRVCQVCQALVWKKICSGSCEQCHELAVWKRWWAASLFPRGFLDDYVKRTVSGRTCPAAGSVTSHPGDGSETEPLVLSPGCGLPQFPPTHLGSITSTWFWGYFQFFVWNAVFLYTPHFFCALIPSCFFSMQVIGNIGRTMEQLTPKLPSSVLKCIKSRQPSLLIQKAAIQALRKMELRDEVKSTEEDWKWKVYSDWQGFGMRF